MKKEKIENIYNVVLNLMAKKAESTSISLNDIANECNIGKSTLYEYFKSKEELLYNAIYFHLNNCLENLNQIEGSTAKELFYSYLNKIFEMRESYYVVIKSLLLSNYSKKSTCNGISWSALEKKARQALERINRKIIMMGQEEGIYRKDLDDFDYIFCQLAIFIALSTDEINLNARVSYDKEILFERLYEKTLKLIG